MHLNDSQNKLWGEKREQPFFLSLDIWAQRVMTFIKFIFNIKYKINM